MNVTELARRLKIPTQVLREIIPKLGFDIGMKAIKVDDKIAREILKILSQAKTREKYLKEEPSKIEEEEEKPKAENVIFIPPVIVVKELAKMMNLPITKVILELMKNGVMVSLNERIDFETAAIIAEDLGFKVEREEGKVIDLKREKRERLELFKDDPKKRKPRPPVVVVMGHVDHGKTALLDAIRQTNVMAEEAGSITQHIGAYQVTIPPQEALSSHRRARDDFAAFGHKITFIDTPGHEAFSQMRSRGAKVADIAILVVAADDGVQPQTIEAISHIKNAELPFIVAINKIDKKEANIEKVKKELSEIGLIPEDWGGKTICVEISAKKKQNIHELLEMILLISQMEKDKIQADPEREAAGTIIESRLDKGEGPVATALIQTGTLNQKDLVRVGRVHGKIKAIRDWQGRRLEKAKPSMPVEILGLRSLPQVGEILQVIKDKCLLRKETKKISIHKFRLAAQTIRPKEPKEEGEEQEKEIKKLNIILKADTIGSIEAIIEALDKVQHEEVIVNLVHQGLGNITEMDIQRAEDLKAHLIGFHVQAPAKALRLAKSKEIEIKLYRVIYDLTHYIKEEVEKLLPQIVKKEELGKVRILVVFRTEKNYLIVGGRVEEGKVTPQAKVKVYRNLKEVGGGEIQEIQIAKREVKEAPSGKECGLKIKGVGDIKVDDVLEIYKEEMKERKLAD